MEIRLMTGEAELLSCAQLMFTSAPWVTLQFDQQQCIDAFRGVKENYIITDGTQVAGFAILQLKGAFSGYIQSICIAEAYRNKKLGEALLQFCEARILRDMPNVFLCVSSFNEAAQRFYHRHGYHKVGEIKDLLVRGYDEYLLRKTTGPRMEFKAT